MYTYVFIPLYNVTWTYIMYVHINIYPSKIMIVLMTIKNALVITWIPWVNFAAQHIIVQGHVCSWETRLGCDSHENFLETIYAGSGYALLTLRNAFVASGAVATTRKRKHRFYEWEQNVVLTALLNDLCVISQEIWLYNICISRRVNNNYYTSCKQISWTCWMKTNGCWK